MASRFTRYDRIEAIACAGKGHLESDESRNSWFPTLGCQTDPRTWGVYRRFISSRYWLDLVRLDVHISDVLHVGGTLKTGRGARSRNRPL